MITEEEARTKWCPHVRATVGRVNNDGTVTLDKYATPHNRVQNGDGSNDFWHHAHACLGSACMAWRWSGPKEIVEYEYVSPVRLANEINPPFSNCPEGFEVASYGTGFTYTARRARATQAGDGYCGLAGKP